MGCRIGMATDVDKRVEELKNKGLVPLHAVYAVLERGLTYEDANLKERRARQACGPHCDGNLGGGFIPGNRWSVYRINW